jgi:hypothetical protein
MSSFYLFRQMRKERKMTATKPFIAAALMALMFSAQRTEAQESIATISMKPLMASSFDSGNEHIVGYFLNDEGVCKLTLMIAEPSLKGAATRLKVSIDGGKSAALDTDEGKSLRFECKSGALAMSAVTVNRVAFRGIQ